MGRILQATAVLCLALAPAMAAAQSPCSELNGEMSGISMLELVFPGSIAPMPEEEGLGGSADRRSTEPIFWCAGPDDPRCTLKQHGGTSGSTQLSDSTLKHPTPHVQHPWAPAVGRVWPTCASSEPSDGVRDRLERPPRT